MTRIIDGIKHPRNRETAHAGWLLACDAPDNIAKGERKLAALSVGQQTVALAHRDALRALYASVKSQVRKAIQPALIKPAGAR